MKVTIITITIIIDYLTLSNFYNEPSNFTHSAKSEHK